MGVPRAWEQFSRVSRSNPLVKGQQEKSKESGNGRRLLMNVDISLPLQLTGNAPAFSSQIS